MQEAVVEAIGEEMQRDRRVFHLGQSIGATFNGAMNSTKGLGQKFGDARIIDTPMSEWAMVSAGVGAAISGTRPIVQIMFGEFLSLVMAPLACDGASIHYRSGGKASVPLVVRTLYGTGPHRGHPEDYHSWLCGVPGLKVVIPSSPRDAKGLMTAAIRDDNPVVFFEHMGLYHASREEVPSSGFTIPLGQAEIKRPGREVTVVGAGMMVPLALRAAEKLAKEGIDVEVIDPRTISPLDRDTVLTSVAKTRRLVVVSEGGAAYDSMAEVVAAVAEELGANGAIRVARVGAVNVPRPFALTLERQAVPNEQRIVAAINKVLQR